MPTSHYTSGGRNARPHMAPPRSFVTPVPNPTIRDAPSSTGVQLVPLSSTVTPLTGPNTSGRGRNNHPKAPPPTRLSRWGDSDSSGSNTGFQPTMENSIHKALVIPVIPVRQPLQIGFNDYHVGAILIALAATQDYQPTMENSIHKALVIPVRQPLQVGFNGRRALLFRRIVGFPHPRARGVHFLHHYLRLRVIRRYIV